MCTSRSASETGGLIRAGRSAILPCVRWWRAKQCVNLMNGSTLVGLAVGYAGGARFSRGPRGLVLATGFHLAPPWAGAFTLGNVVVTVHDRDWLDVRPRLLRHEERHSWQYVACLGLPMLPMYLLAAGWSFLRQGNLATGNPFERLAGLADGGYPV